MKMFYAFVGWWMILKKFALHKYNILLIKKSLTEKNEKEYYLFLETKLYFFFSI